MEGRLGPWDDGGSLLCFFNASLTTPRCVLAWRGKEGCDSLVKLEEKENADVVGRVNGKGIVQRQLLGFLSEQQTKLNDNAALYVPNGQVDVKV
jgi:hypothetical protein